MQPIRLGFLGFGNVGQALLALLESKRQELEQRYDLRFLVTGIATHSHGSAVDQDGIEIDAALSAGHLSKLSAFSIPQDALEFIRLSEAQVIFESTPVNYTNGQPAVDYLRYALQSGKHAITANKGPVVHAYRELKDLAAANGVSFYFESAVMDGAPIFSLFRETLPAARLKSIRGVLNSTTNMILTRMEAGESFDQAVAFCQQIGIAETDPHGDIDGWDAAVKICALVNVLMDFPLKPVEVPRQGIAHLTAQDVQSAAQQGQRWKLVCSAEQQVGGVRAQVAPQLVAAGSPLYQAQGTTSIVTFETDVLGPLTIIEQDPGRATTAYGMLADMLRALDRIEPVLNTRA